MRNKGNILRSSACTLTHKVADDEENQDEKGNEDELKFSCSEKGKGKGYGSWNGRRAKAVAEGCRHADLL